ncbi:MAG TPA: hypothetical protein VJ768_11555, partial [Anaerolineales bacterium]|nr:hypothetical protein [Anaerolineales bacterium]
MYNKYFLIPLSKVINQVKNPAGRKIYQFSKGSEMAEKSTKTQKKAAPKRVSVSKKKLAGTAEEMEAQAVVKALDGVSEMVEGEKTLQAAGDVARLAALGLASGTSDL